MKEICFTAGQFAALHHLNKRTLHYYDDIGLFSPDHKGDNGYRYYTYRQSAELENILSLRELGMSIDEIKEYLTRPCAEAFLRIASDKTCELSKQIRRLEELKELLTQKQEALKLCSRIHDGQIEILRLPARQLLVTPLSGTEGSETFETDGDMERIMEHLRLAWEYSPGKTGCGTCICIDKVKRGEFDVYDGLFTPVGHPEKGGGFTLRPEGDYLCGYCVGSWDKIPGLYRKMLAFAEAKGLTLTGSCYETGLNEFAISCPEEYVTQIVVRVCR